MEKNKNYHDEQNNMNTLKMREVLTTLPSFCKQFFRGIQDYTSSRTRLAYAYDLRVFFEFMHENNPYCNKVGITELPLSVLDHISREDIEEYMDYLTLYIKDGKEITNDERGKKRKLSALKSFYNYYYTSEQIKTNPAALVPLPKLHEKEIIRLDADEVATLLDQVEDGDKLTKRELVYHKKTRIRDVALLTLLLGTGIRVSECVGLDLNDVDFKNNGIKIRRKGGYETVVYFGDEVQDALLDYLEQRHHVIPCEGHEEALFLSLQNRRITVRAVENLVKTDEHIIQLYRYSIRGFPPLPEKISIGVFIPSALCGLALLYIATDLLTASSACLKSISPSLKSHPFFRVLFILSARHCEAGLPSGSC